MCRNIRVLHDFDPPTTPDEIRAAAVQYVRKVGGITKLGLADEIAFTRAVDAIAEATSAWLAELAPRREPRTREGERDRAKARWERRQLR